MMSQTSNDGRQGSQGALTQVDFAKGLTALYSVCEQRLDDLQKSFWFQAVRDLTGEQWLRACVTLMQTHKWPRLPSIAELRDVAIGPDNKPVTADQRALIAWNAVLDAVSRVGGYASVDFDDPVVHAAINAIAGQGGWSTLCDVPSEELRTWKRKEFLETYKAFLPVGIRPESHLPLHGLIARDCAAKQLPAPEPVKLAIGLPAPTVKNLGLTPDQGQVNQAVASLALSFGKVE